MDVLDSPKYSYLIKKQPFYYKVFKTLFYYYSKLVFTFYTPVTVSGRKNIPNDSFIFSSNHNSHLDVALLSVAAKKDYNHFQWAPIPESKSLMPPAKRLKRTHEMNYIIMVQLLTIQDMIMRDNIH